MRSRPWKNLKSYLGSVKSLDTPVTVIFKGEKRIWLACKPGWNHNLTFILFESDFFVWRRRGRRWRLRRLWRPTPPPARSSSAWPRWRKSRDTLLLIYFCLLSSKVSGLLSQRLAKSSVCKIWYLWNIWNFFCINFRVIVLVFNPIFLWLVRVLLFFPLKLYST